MPLHPSLNTSRCEKASKGRLRRAWRGCQCRVRQQAGFTIIEVLVAAIVLIVGLLTTFEALDVTVHTSYVTRAREGAINLARQITEDTRALQYSQLTNSSAVTSLLQAMPGLGSSSSGSTWTIARRGVTYTINVTETDQAAVSLQTLSQKQVGVNISWKIQGVPHSHSETTTISSGGQGLNMSASSLEWVIPSTLPVPCSSPCSATTPVITSPMNQSTMTFSVQTPSQMSGVTWEINGVTQSWSSSLQATSATTWTWTTTTSWNIANLPDGTYEIGAAAQNGSSIGNYTKIYVRLQRGTPSAPSFSAESTDGYGFNTNLYTNYPTSSTTSTVAELDWTGSNSPSSTGSPGDYNVVGYKIASPTGATCQTGLTNLSGSTTSFPGTCGTSFWCSTATACIDLSPPSTTASNLTYTVAALYYNSSNVLATGPTASAPLSGQSATTYTLAPTTQNTSTNCPGGSPQNDLRTTYSPGSTDTTTSTTATSVTAVFCSNTFGQTTNIATGGTATAYFTNASTTTCTVTGTLSLDGTVSLPSVSVTVAKSTATPTPYTFTWTGGTTYLAASTDRIVTTFSWSSCGTSTKPTELHYGGSTYTSKFVTNTFPIQAPDPPTSPSISTVTNSDGTTTATLTWNAPTSGISVNAYRIYRDGKNYTNRYYYDTANNLCSSGTCTWTDTERSATHSYYVTAVGNSTAGSDMAESSMAGPVTG